MTRSRLVTMALAIVVAPPWNSSGAKVTGMVFWSHTSRAEMPRQEAGGPQGLERFDASPQSDTSLRESTKSGAAKSDALDATLQELIDCWAELPEQIRGAVLVMVRAAGPR